MSEGRFQVGAGAIIRNSITGKVLLVHRSASHIFSGTWEVPIGRLKQFESFEDGLRREVKEETGLGRIKIVRPLYTFEVMHGDGTKTARNDVRAVVYLAVTDEVEVTLSEEHNAFEWATLERAASLAGFSDLKRAFRELAKARG